MKKSRLWISSFIIILVVFISVLNFPLSGILELNTQTLRAKTLGYNEVTAPIVILAIDDASFEKINIRWPWPRQILAEAIIKLKDDGAKVIGLDIMLGESGYTLEEDEALTNAIKYAGNVVLPSKRDERKSSGYVIEYFDEPISYFSDNAVTSGYVNLLLDKDKYIRRLLPIDSSLGETKHSFSFSIIETYEGRNISTSTGNINIGKHKIPTAHDNSFLINYADVGGFPVIPFYELLEGNIKKDIFKDKIVLIGAYFKDSHDQFLTVSEDLSGIYGVEIHANSINTVFSGNFLTDNSRSVELLIILLLTIIGSFLFLRLKPLKGLLFLGIIITVYLILASYLYLNRGLILEVFDPILAISLTWLCSVLYNYLIVEKEKKYVRNTFSRFVSAEVVNNILDSENEIELGGELRDVAIFFSDICGFTSISENMKPSQIVEMLNEYFTEMTDIIFKYDGTLNKYIGDAIMAIFGAPIQSDNNSERAVRVSLEMRTQLNLLNEKRIIEGKAPIKIGMGLHKGKVLVGNIGSTRQMEYTVIGDAVNVCSRIEGLTRIFDTDLLISDDLYREVKDLVNITTCEPIDVKGKSEKILVHKVISLKGDYNE
ncbi:MAG: adenylate/guanylate cyclase domain-containing protein [Spirochaetaceae bacterium]